jgi:hypothetical protein
MDVNALRAAWQADRSARLHSHGKGLTIALSLAAVPSLVGLAWAGHSWGRALMAEDPRNAGWALAILLGSLALLSGTWDGTCSLRFAAFRPFMVRPGSLFLAEMGVGLWTPVKRFLWASGAAFCMGMAWARPALTPWMLLILPALMLSLLAMERMVGVLTRLFSRTFKTLLIFGALFLGMRRLLAFLMAGGNLRHTTVHHQLVSSPGDSSALARVLPTTWLVGAAQAVVRHRWPLAGFLAFLGGLAGLLLLAFWMLRPDLLGMCSPASVGPFASPWRFKHARIGVMRQQLHRIWSSKMGRLLLFLPIVALASLIDPLVFGFRPGSTWILAWAGFMLVPIGRKLACNLFGLDRGGARGFWTLPIEDRDLLVGKLTAVALYQGLIVTLLMLCLALASPLRPEEIPGGAFLCVSLCLFHLRIGLRRSLEEPFPLDPEALNPAELDDPTLTTLGRLLLPWLGLTTTWGLSIRMGPRIALASMLAASLFALWALFRSIPGAVQLLSEQREALTLRLEGGQRLPAVHSGQ